MNVNPGKFKDKITLQRPAVATKDTDGYEITTPYVDVLTIWASIMPISSKELLISQQEKTAFDIKVMIRYRTDITSAWKIKQGTKIYDVVGSPIKVNGQNSYLQLMCREVI